MSSASSPTRPQPPPTQPRAITRTTFVGSPLGKLAPTGLPRWVVLLEALLLPACAVLLGWWLHPEDPLWVHTDFHWAWLAPMVVALRYGPLTGLLSTGVLLAGWWVFQVQYTQFPQVFFLGGLILVLLVGEFSSLWVARTRRAESMQHYLHQRMEHLIRQYYLLRLSHDRLEHELIGRPMSMRDALKTLRGLDSMETGAGTLLGLLSQYCQIGAAAVYVVQDDTLASQPLASIGAPLQLHTHDPLLCQALETRKLCHVVQTLALKQQSQYLMAAPLLDLGGEIYGVLLVDDMPFFALQEENLQTINLLLGYYTDGLSAQTLAQPLLQHWHDCPTEFAFELQRLWHMHQSTGVPSMVVALEFTHTAIAQDLPQQLLRLRRLMDETWLLEGQNRQLLAVLMPLGDAATAEGFLARLENWMHQKQATSLADAGIFPHQLPLSQTPPMVLLQRLHEIIDAQ